MNQLPRLQIHSLDAEISRRHGDIGPHSRPSVPSVTSVTSVTPGAGRPAPNRQGQARGAVQAGDAVRPVTPSQLPPARLPLPGSAPVRRYGSLPAETSAIAAF